MKKANSQTLSQHLLREADGFLLFPERVRRTPATLAFQKAHDAIRRQLVEWRKTFSPRQKVQGFDDVLTSPVMLDELYCRELLRAVPGMVERTQALAALTLPDLRPSEALVYMREAANSYILGMAQASVALSRAAVDVRLRELAAGLVGSEEARKADLMKLIDDFSIRGRFLSREGRTRAHFVRTKGNDVLHVKPTDHPMALKVFESAREVVLELNRSSARPNRRMEPTRVGS